MSKSSVTSLFLCGDTMTGRGIDQILAHPSRPQLFERYVRSAGEYVALAERASGPIARPVDAAYVWGDALAVLGRLQPDARIINLETAVTTSEDAWPDKGIHYRMHPDNIDALTVARPDCCVLANNHVLDWGHAGLRETLQVLAGACLRCAGAGRDLDEAMAPAVIGLPAGRRVLVFAAAVATSGVPGDWAATGERAGVFFLPDVSPPGAATLVAAVERHREPGDLVVVSLHWGSNWGYDVGREERSFAHRLVEGGVDVVHGHSSHHPKGIEVYRERLILYGCGDFLNDYEGIGGYEAFRPELGLMYLPTLEAAGGRLLELALVPTRIRRLRVSFAPEEGAKWQQAMLNHLGRQFGTRVERSGDRFLLRWD